MAHALLSVLRLLAVLLLLRLPTFAQLRDFKPIHGGTAPEDRDGDIGFRGVSLVQ